MKKDSNNEVARPGTKFRYQTHGPFFLDSNLLLTSRVDANDFWDEIDEQCEGLRGAIGIYIFVKQATSRSPFIPWYVGKTDAGFERRFRQHSKLFSNLKSKRGRTAFFLLARNTKGSTKRFMKSRKTRLRANDVLETMLIERSLEVNPHLLNANKVVIVKGLVVPGFKHDRAGKPNSSAQGLRLVLSGRNNKEQ